MRETLEEFLQEQEDILISESRLRDSSDPTISLEEMRRRLGLLGQKKIRGLEGGN